MGVASGRDAHREGHPSHNWTARGFSRTAVALSAFTRCRRITARAHLSPFRNANDVSFTAGASEELWARAAVLLVAAPDRITSVGDDNCGETTRSGSGISGELEGAVRQPEAKRVQRGALQREVDIQIESAFVGSVEEVSPSSAAAFGGPCLSKVSAP